MSQLNSLTGSFGSSSGSHLNTPTSNSRPTAQTTIVSSPPSSSASSASKSRYQQQHSTTTTTTTRSGEVFLSSMTPPSGSILRSSSDFHQRSGPRKDVGWKPQKQQQHQQQQQDEEQHQQEQEEHYHHEQEAVEDQQYHHPHSAAAAAAAVKAKRTLSEESSLSSSAGGAVNVAAAAGVGSHFDLHFTSSSNRSPAPQAPLLSSPPSSSSIVPAGKKHQDNSFEKYNNNDIFAHSTTSSAAPSTASTTTESNNNNNQTYHGFSSYSALEPSPQSLSSGNHHHHHHHQNNHVAVTPLNLSHTERSFNNNNNNNNGNSLFTVMETENNEEEEEEEEDPLAKINSPKCISVRIERAEPQRHLVYNFTPALSLQEEKEAESKKEQFETSLRKLNRQALASSGEVGDEDDYEDDDDDDNYDYEEYEEECEEEETDYEDHEEDGARNTSSGSSSGGIFTNSASDNEQSLSRSGSQQSLQRLKISRTTHNTLPSVTRIPGQIYSDDEDDDKKHSDPLLFQEKQLQEEEEEVKKFSLSLFSSPLSSSTSKIPAVTERKNNNNNNNNSNNKKKKVITKRKRRRRKQALCGGGGEGDDDDDEQNNATTGGGITSGRSLPSETTTSSSSSSSSSRKNPHSLLGPAAAAGGGSGSYNYDGSYSGLSPLSQTLEPTALIRRMPKQSIFDVDDDDNNNNNNNNQNLDDDADEEEKRKREKKRLYWKERKEELQFYKKERNLRKKREGGEYVPSSKIGLWWWQVFPDLKNKKKSSSSSTSNNNNKKKENENEKEKQKEIAEEGEGVIGGFEKEVASTLAAKKREKEKKRKRRMEKRKEKEQQAAGKRRKEGGGSSVLMSDSDSDSDSSVSSSDGTDSTLSTLPSIPDEEIDQLRLLQEQQKDDLKSFREFLEINSESRCLLGTGLSGESLTLLPNNLKTDSSNLKKMRHFKFIKQLNQRLLGSANSHDVYLSMKSEGWLDTAEAQEEAKLAIQQHAQGVTEQARNRRLERLQEKPTESRPIFSFLEEESNETVMNRDRKAVLFVEPSERSRAECDQDDAELEEHSMMTHDGDADYLRERSRLWREVIVAARAGLILSDLKGVAEGERMLTNKLGPLARRICAQWRLNSKRINAVRLSMASLAPPPIKILKKSSPLFREWSEDSIRDFLNDAIENTRFVLSVCSSSVPSLTAKLSYVLNRVLEKKPRQKALFLSSHHESAEELVEEDLTDEDFFEDEEAKEARRNRVKKRREQQYAKVQQEQEEQEQEQEQQQQQDGGERKRRKSSVTAAAGGGGAGGEEQPEERKVTRTTSSVVEWRKLPCRVETYRYGECIFHAGDPGDSIFIIAQGEGIVELLTVKSHHFYKTGTKSKVKGGTVVETIFANSVFGDIDALILAPRLATARVASPSCTVFRFSRRHLFRSLSAMPPSVVDNMIQESMSRRQKFIRVAYPLTKEMLLRDEKFAKSVAHWDAVAVDKLVAFFTPRSLVSHAGAEHVQRDVNICCFFPLNTTLSVHATVLPDDLSAAQRHECQVEALLFGTCRSFSKLRHQIVPDVPPGSLYGFSDVILGEEMHTWLGYRGIAVTAKGSGDTWCLSRSDYHRVALEHAATSAVETRKHHLAIVAAKIERPPVPSEVLDNYCLQFLFLPNVLRAVWQDYAMCSLMFTGDLICREGGVVSSMSRAELRKIKKQQQKELKLQREEKQQQQQQKRQLSTSSSSSSSTNPSLSSSAIVEKHQQQEVEQQEEQEKEEKEELAEQKPDNEDKKELEQEEEEDDDYESGDDESTSNNNNDFSSSSSSFVETQRSDIFVVTRGAVSIHSQLPQAPAAESLVCEETPGQALIVGAFEFGLNSKSYLMSVRCSSVCEVWQLPAFALEKKMREKYPLIWGALERVCDSQVLKAACARQFEDPTFLNQVTDWPSSTGVYLPPKEELAAWRASRHRQLRELVS